MTALHLVISPGTGKLNDRIASVLKVWNGYHGVSQSQLATALGITQPGVSKRLEGIVPFNTDEIEKLADFYQTTPEVLMGFADQPEPKPRYPKPVDRRRRGSSGPRAQQWRTLSTPLNTPLAA